MRPTLYRYVEIEIHIAFLPKLIILLFIELTNTLGRK